MKSYLRTSAVASAAALVCGLLLACPVITGKSAALWDVGENKMVFHWYPTQPRSGAGSTTKIVTLFTALWAEANGYVDFNDVVVMSQRATQQGCQCLADVDNNGLPDAVPGEVFLFGDLLYGISVSAGEVTDAVAEHVASALYHGGAPATSVADSELRMREFVALANQFAGQYLDAHNTWLANVHGGDGCDFAIGCYDESHQLCSKGSPCDHGTTAKDMVSMWRNARYIFPMFESILGTTSYPIWSVPPGSTTGKLYMTSKNLSWYPGLQGDKNGRSPASDNSHIAQATRCGHTLIASTQNSPWPQAWNDMIELFDYGFEQYCAVDFEIELPGAAPSSSAMRGAASLGNRPARASYGADADDPLEVEVWADLAPGSATATAVAEIPRSMLPPEAEPDDGLDVAFVDEALLATAVVRDDGAIVLSRWSVGPDATGLFSVAHLGDTLVPGERFERVRLVHLGPGLLLLAGRDEFGTMQLQTWTVDASRAAMRAAGAPGDAPRATRFDLAVAGGAIDPATGTALPYTALSTAETADGLEIVQWEIDPSGGSIRRIGSARPGEHHGASIAATGDPAGATFASAAVDGFVGSTGLRLHFWQATAAGPELVREVDATTTDPAQHDTAIAPVPGAGPFSVHVIYADARNGRMRITSWDAPSDGFAPEDLAIARRFAGVSQPVVMDALPIGTSGKLLISTQGPAGSGEAQLSIWRRSERSAVSKGLIAQMVAVP